AQTQPASTLTDVPPVASVQGPGAGTVGVPVVFNSSVIDTQPGRTFTYAWSVTNDLGTFTLPANAVTDEPFFVFTPTQIDHYTISLTVTDNLGDSGSAQIPFVAGAPGPDISFGGAPFTSSIGTTVSLNSSILEPTGATPSSYDWSV